MLKTDKNWTNQFLTETLSGNLETFTEKSTGCEEKIEPELDLGIKLESGSAVDLGKGLIS